MKWLALLALAGTAHAVEVCPIDLTGTFPSSPGFNLPNPNICWTCRELVDFSIDFNNETWNCIRKGVCFTAYDKYFGNLKASNTATTTFRLRNINQLGQAANTSIITVFRLEHYTDNSVAYCPTPSIRRVAIERWHVYTMLYNGDSFERTFVAGQTPSYLPVPATPADDGYDPTKDCLYNDGTRRQ